MNYAAAIVQLIMPITRERSVVKDTLFNIGFRAIRFGSTRKDMVAALGGGPLDLLIIGSQFPDFEILDMVREIRAGNIGSNPFLTIMTISIDSAEELVTKVIDSGTDDIIIYPFSDQFILNRFNILIDDRKPFVVTSDYIGPDRRKKSRKQKGPSLPLLDVPNALKERVHNSYFIAPFQQEILKARREINKQRIERHCLQVPWLLERILPEISVPANLKNNEKVKDWLNRLREVCEEVQFLVVGTPFEHIGGLCGEIDKVAKRIIGLGEKIGPRENVNLAKLARDFALGVQERAIAMAKVDE
jgi:DNA-binding response OmpR family regulator